MSIWDKLSPEEKASTDYETEGLTLIPEKTCLITNITELRWAEMSEKMDNPGEKYISLKVNILQGQYKNKPISKKFRVNHKDPEKAKREAQFFVVLNNNMNEDCKIPDGTEPTDMLLSKMLNGILKIRVMTYDFTKSGGGSGNWISQIFPKEYDINGETAPAPEPTQGDDVPF